jgi:hypothetical protein
MKLVLKFVKPSLIVAFGFAIFLQSCAYNMADKGGATLTGGSGGLQGQIITMYDNKQIPGMVFVEVFTDARPAEEMKRDVRAKNNPKNLNLDYFTYGERYAQFDVDLLSLTADYLGRSMIFRGIGTGIKIGNPEFTMRGKVLHYYGYYEPAVSDIGGAVLGDVGTAIINGTKEMPSGGLIEIAIEITNNKTNTVAWKGTMRYEGPSKDTFVPSDRSWAQFEYADSRLYQRAFNNLTEQLAKANLKP